MPQCLNAAYIVIDVEKCKGCRICLSVCPNRIIGLSPDINQSGYNPAVVIEEKANSCTGCIACAMMCPDTAISVYRCNKGVSKPLS